MIDKIQKLKLEIEDDLLNARCDCENERGCDNAAYSYQLGAAWAFNKCVEKLTLLLNSESENSGKNDELRQPTLQQHNVIGSLLGLKNQEIAFRVFFFDGSDYSTGQMLSFNEAMAEKYVEWDLHKLRPSDECCIITRFTGFYDKNYNPIWEGDIVSKAGAVIVWHQPLGCWCFQFKGSKEAPTPLFYDNNLEKSEVLGNVFENPELLEGVK